MLGDGLDVDSAIDGGLRDVGVAVERGPGEVELDDELVVEGQRLGDGLRSFHEEEPGVFPGGALGQLCHGTNPRRTRIVDHAASLREVLPTPPQPALVIPYAG